MELEQITIQIKKDDPEQYRVQFEGVVHKHAILVLNDLLIKLTEELEEQEDIQITPIVGGDEDVLN